MLFLPSLKKSGHLEKVNITVAIVGSRKIETRDDYASQCWDIFAPNLTIYGFDADVEACNQANANLAARQVNWTEKHIPLALSNREGNSTLYVTKYPGCSSLYPPSEDYIKRFSGDSELIELESTIEVSTTTLDLFCQREGVKEIDFLHLDIQGAELNVIKGASQILESVLGLITEVEFTEIYSEQPLFSDVDICLRKNGFSLFDFSEINRDRRRDIPLFSPNHPGALIWTDAFYFRDLMGSDLSPHLKTPDRLLKLACLADLMEFPDYTLEILEYLTVNYGRDPQYNFAQNIMECLKTIPELVKLGLESLPIVERLREYLPSNSTREDNRDYLTNLEPELVTNSTRNWSRTFLYKGKPLPYNRIGYNNVGERAVEIPIALNFLATLEKKNKILEVGNTLSHYENVLSDYLGIGDRQIVDKFEVAPGVDNIDLMDLPTSEKYDGIISVSTVEHIAQGVEPSGTYGENMKKGDLESPLKAITKIYDLLAVGGKALITVPFGKLMDFEWFIQFSYEYLQNLTEKYQIPPTGITTGFMRILDMELPLSNPRQIWVEETAEKLNYVEYNYPYPCANAIAIIELTKQETPFLLNLEVPTTELTYHKPVCEKDSICADLVTEKFLALLSQLKPLNLIFCPDWLQPEESLCTDLEKVIKTWISHPEQNQMTLLIERGNFDEEEANLILGTVTMNILMAENLEVWDEPTIILLEQLSLVQYSALLPRLHSQIVVDSSVPNLPQFPDEFINLSQLKLESFREGRFLPRSDF
jgi:FkbM family methyltransferase